MSLRSRNVCFTLNNPTFTPSQFQERIDLIPASYSVFGEETAPTTGTRHYQGYLEFHTAVTYARIKRFLGNTIHLEARRGTAEQASDYCKKEGTFHEKGDISRQGNRSDIHEGVATLRSEGLKAVARDHPDQIVKYHRGYQSLLFLDLSQQQRTPPDVCFLFGPTGCGKTRYAYGTGDGVAKLCLSQGWFDGYLGEHTVIFDDFDGGRSRVALSQLLNYIDRYPVLVPVKGNHVPLVATTIYITSNIHWKQWYDYSERLSQYPALVRRFTRVIAWPRAGVEPLDIRPNTPAWTKFLLGPFTTGPIVEDANEDDVYYTFIE